LTFHSFTLIYWFSLSLADAIARCHWRDYYAMPPLMLYWYADIIRHYWCRYWYWCFATFAIILLFRYWYYFISWYYAIRYWYAMRHFHYSRYAFHYITLPQHIFAADIFIIALIYAIADTATRAARYHYYYIIAFIFITLFIIRHYFRQLFRFVFISIFISWLIFIAIIISFRLPFDAIISPLRYFILPIQRCHYDFLSPLLLLICHYFWYYVISIYYYAFIFSYFDIIIAFDIRWLIITFSLSLFHYFFHFDIIFIFASFSFHYYATRMPFRLAITLPCWFSIHWFWYW